MVGSIWYASCYVSPVITIVMTSLIITVCTLLSPALDILLVVIKLHIIPSFY
jgi:hypothetical protein